VLLASTIGQIAHPFFVAFAWLIAEFYALIPNYAVAIALLTIAVMVVVFPINRRATRSMMKMQLLAPEIRKLQAKYKAQPGATVQERQEARQRLNEELMALYRENNVSPTGGCLPMLLQFPIFWILYMTIRGLTHEGVGNRVLAPLYIDRGTRLYRDIIQQNLHTAHPQLNAFGINLADSVRTSWLTWGQKVPFIILILLAIGLQYVQMKQLNGRNPAAAQANPQMQQMQKIFPVIFAIIYISIPAGVNVYFIVSSLFRIAQQEYMYRRDPHIRESLARLHARARADGKVVDAKVRVPAASRAKGLFGRVFATPALEPGENGGGRPPARTAEAPKKGAIARTTPAGEGRSHQRRPHPRAQGKRPRKPR
jgi:YidC/Oxa1 family membrane protein insertase